MSVQIPPRRARPGAYAEPLSVGELFSLGAKLAGDLGYARPGNLIIITAGAPIGEADTTNMLKVERVGG